MATMEYCKWENTSTDMQLCVNSMEFLDEEFQNMNEHEKAGVLRALRLAAEMLEYAPRTLLDEAGVELNRLPQD